MYRLCVHTRTLFSNKSSPVRWFSSFLALYNKSSTYLVSRHSKYHTLHTQNQFFFIISLTFRRFKLCRKCTKYTHAKQTHKHTHPNDTILCLKLKPEKLQNIQIGCVRFFIPFLLRWAHIAPKLILSKQKKG